MQPPKKTFVLCALCLLILQYTAQNNSTPLDSALIACYPFSGNANDQTGNGNNGVVNGAVLVADRFGNAASAYSFNGANQNVVIPNFSNQITGNEFSISFWSTSSLQATRSAFLASPDDPANRINIHIYYLNQLFWDFGSIYGTGRLYLASCSLPPANQWDHWVFTHSAAGNFMRVYRNGVLFASQNASSTFSNQPVKNLMIGGGVGWSNSYLWFDGKLDDIKIYHRALIQNDVNQLYAGNFNCSPCAAPPAPVNNTSSAFLTPCAGVSTTLSASSSGTVNWFASPGSTIVASGTTFITPPLSAGVYTYYAAAMAACGQSTLVPFTFTVQSGPAISISGPTMVCQGAPVSLTVSGAGTYTWNDGSTTPVLDTIAYTNMTFSVTASAQGSCASVAGFMLNVNPLPMVSITGPFTACAGETFSITAGGASTYSWNTGVTGPVLSTSAQTTTQYSVTGVDQNGCEGSAFYVMWINPDPTVTIAGTGTFCAGSSVTLTASGANNYSWTSGSNTSTLITSPVGSGWIGVTGLDLNGCMDTDSILLIERPLPAVMASANKKEVCLGDPVTLSASGATSYSWSTGGTASVVTIGPQSSQVYTVTGFVNGCAGIATVTVGVNGCVGLHELDAASGITVLPNPGKGIFYLVSEKDQRCHIRVCDALGKLILQKELHLSSAYQESFDLGQAAGIYYLEITGENASRKQLKLLVE